MFLFIAKYEWLLLKANRMLLVLAGITTLILFFALYEGYQRVSFQQGTLHQISRQEQDDYAKYRQQIAAASPSKNFDGGHFGDPTNPFYFGNRMGARYAVLQPAPLAILSSGQSDVYPYYYKVSLSKKQALYHSEELENPQILFNGRFDVSFAIIFLLPLLVIVFSYNVYAIEKEAGTLSILMAQNTSVNKVVGFRFLFRYLLLNLFVTAQLILGLAIFGRGALSAPSLTGVLSLIWLYTAFWFALSYWINSYKRSSGFNATALTGSWLLLVLVVPTIISTSVDLLHPLPSRLDLITHARNVSDSLAKNANALSRFLEEHPEFKPAKPGREDRNAVSLRNRIEVEMAVEKARASFDAVVQTRETVVNNYRFLSPAIFIQQSLNKAAGTNDDRFKAFGKEVAAFQKNYRSFFEPLIYRQEKFTVAHLDKVPSFPTQSTLLPVAANRQLLADHLFLATLIATLLTVALFKWKGTSKSKVTSTVQNNNLNLSRRKKELVQDAVEDLP